MFYETSLDMNSQDFKPTYSALQLDDEQLTPVHCVLLGVAVVILMNETLANEKDQNIVPAVQFKEFLPFGHQGDGVSTIAQEPVGVAASSNGTVAVADLANDLIKVFSKGGKLVRELDHYEKQNGKDVCLLCPTGLAFDNSGNIVVVERGRHRVTVMTPDGKLLRGFGRRGKANGQL